MTRFPRAIRRFLRRESATATVEFVLSVPVLLMVFMASIESGLFMTRYISMDRAVDITMRNLRLGQYPNPDHDLLKREICSRTSIIQDCQNSIRIDLQPVDSNTWAMPTTATQCLDRSAPIRPSIAVFPGQPNDLMLVRVCVVQDPVFPSSGIGLLLRRVEDTAGGYGLITVSSFANEP